VNRLILIKSSTTDIYEDKSAQVQKITFVGARVRVVFYGSSKPYEYAQDRVRVLSNPKPINLADTIVCIDDVPAEQLVRVDDFGEYVRVINSKGTTTCLPRHRVSYHEICVAASKEGTVFTYLAGVAQQLNVTEQGQSLLGEQYQKMGRINPKSVLATYLSAAKIKKAADVSEVIFPFGFNLSQKKAVEQALNNSISIIEGPPGTGKTQTILNIIANAVCRGQTVAVVSSNNAAIDNVMEKLKKDGYDFIAASLGHQENQKRFFEGSTGCALDLSAWDRTKKDLTTSADRLRKTVPEVAALLKIRNESASVREHLARLETEQSHFLSEQGGELIPLKMFSLRRHWLGRNILEFLVEYRQLIEQGSLMSWPNRARLFFYYGIHNFAILTKAQPAITYSLNHLYYERTIQEHKQKIAALEGRLRATDFDSLMQQSINLSVDVFRAALSTRYRERGRREFFLKEYKAQFHAFVEHYPVILSTTHSIRNSMAENFIFDYLIIDEASQVDLATAALAMSCCKKAVIVGDLKQLPQIVSQDVEHKSNQLRQVLQISSAYDFSKHSILSSLVALYEQRVARTLLREHYRCHPQIIRYCNEKFYNNELIVMTNAASDEKALQVYRTAPGNHARRIGTGWYNLRQIEVVRDEVLRDSAVESCGGSEVGLIAPYRDHVAELRKMVAVEGIEADTIHKFQGREKQIIVFSTVSNEVNDFIDQPNLINVAVSRAVKKFIVVTSDNISRQHGTHLGDLIRYMTYNSAGGQAVESTKASVFDMLYSEYAELLQLRAIKTKKVSQFQSENLFNELVEEVLAKQEFASFKVALHVPLAMIVKDMAGLNEREQGFAAHPCSHVDFLIYNRMDKEPVLAIEVDGFRYHQQVAKQLERDQVKDRILAQIDLPLLRFATNASGEKERLESRLLQIITASACHAPSV